MSRRDKRPCTLDSRRCLSLPGRALRRQHEGRNSLRIGAEVVEGVAVGHSPGSAI